MRIVDDTIESTRANIVINLNGLHIIKFHSQTATLIFISCLIVLCCKLLWKKTCNNYFKQRFDTIASTSASATKEPERDQLSPEDWASICRHIRCTTTAREFTSNRSNCTEETRHTRKCRCRHMGDETDVPASAKLIFRLLSLCYDT